jgi:hypothetical protein
MTYLPFIPGKSDPDRLPAAADPGQDVQSAAGFGYPAGEPDVIIEDSAEDQRPIDQRSTKAGGRHRAPDW